MMTDPRKLGNLRLRLARHLVARRSSLRIEHQEKAAKERYSTHAGLEFHGRHLVDF